jgi:excisionase family DNA binding protein
MPMTNFNEHNRPPKLLSIPQAAAELGISRTSVYSLLGTGQLASVRIGRRRLIPVDAIEAAIATLRGAA